MNLYWESFKTFFKIGIFTLGGGYAMIPLIEEEVVNKHKWVEKDEMLEKGAWCHCHYSWNGSPLFHDHSGYRHLLQAV